MSFQDSKQLKPKKLKYLKSNMAPVKVIDLDRKKLIHDEKTSDSEINFPMWEDSSESNVS